MKKLAQITFVLIVVLSFSGCALFHKPDAAFVAAMDAGLNAGPANAAILDKYDAYVDAAAAAGKITADTAKIEHATTAKLRKIVADAKGN
jgi:hypothetical protein